MSGASGLWSDMTDNRTLGRRDRELTRAVAEDKGPGVPLRVEHRARSAP